MTLFSIVHRKLARENKPFKNSEVWGKVTWFFRVWLRLEKIKQGRLKAEKRLKFKSSGAHLKP